MQIQIQTFFTPQILQKERRQKDRQSDIETQNDKEFWRMRERDSRMRDKERQTDREKRNEERDTEQRMIYSRDKQT